MISKKQLNKLLREHERLKDKRHPMFERNRFVKFLMYFMVAYYAACMILLGSVLPMPLSEVYHGVACYHVLDGWFFAFLIADFYLRFVVQETPSNQSRPYTLLPISQSWLMRRYLLRAGRSWGNLFWGFFLVPFALVGVLPSCGFLGMMGWLLGWWLLFVMNSYIYLLFRSLCMKNMWWFAVPFVVHLALLAFSILPATGVLPSSFNVLDMPCTNFMYGFILWQPQCFLVVAALIVFFFRLNARVQRGIVYDEVGKKEDVVVTSTRQYAFFNRFGIVGEYLKLEMKMKMRNNVLKKQFFVLLGCMVLLSGLLYFTSMYDGSFMTSFICLYDYVVPGMATLVTILCYEGNYIDMLMSRKESILDLLTAKYYFNALMLLVPFVLLVPLTFSGKITIWMNLGYLFFTVGVLYPCMFQMAIFNKETLPLNAKLTGRSGNTAQNIVSLTVMFVPVAFERLCVVLLGDPWGYVVIILMGLVGLATHRWWLRSTYRRFMKRRYQNMEGFRATRKS